MSYMLGPDGKEYASLDEMLEAYRAERASRPWYIKLRDWAETHLFISLNAHWHQFTRWTPIYWLRCHTIDRYHLVDIRGHGYDWGWRDTDTRMLYAMFNLLREFVEGEKGLENLDFQVEAWTREAMTRQAAGADREECGFAWGRVSRAQFEAREVRELYLWWTEEYPKAIRQACEDAFDEDAWYEKETEMLLRLVKMRGRLWT